MTEISRVKAITASNINELAEKINCANEKKKVFATQVFPREKILNGNTFEQYYEALIHYKEDDKNGNN